MRFPRCNLLSSNTTSLTTCCTQATRNDNMPNAVWVWDVAKLQQAALVLHMSGVLSWHPSRPLLAIATGSGCVYFWSPNGALCAQIPSDRQFAVNGLVWSPLGGSIVLFDKSRFCVAFTTSGLQAL
eukprot:m.384745 g.384745  ORF g.384745 m.384745 type:complete len:126 (+) comp20999_c0_seq4:215-592(+)